MNEKLVIRVLAVLMTAGLVTTLLAPFWLAVHFGEGWLALNYVTVPVYLALCVQKDRKEGRK